MPKLDTSTLPNTSPSVFDTLLERVYKKGLGLLGLDTPEGSVMSAAMPGVVTAPEGGANGYIVNWYKQRLKQDPSLAYHPGLQALPEFQQAFKELNPNKQIVSDGVQKRTSVFAKDRLSSPPSASGGDVSGILDSAKISAGNQLKKPSKQLTFSDLVASKGNPAPGGQVSGGVKVGPETAQKILDLASKLGELSPQQRVLEISQRLGGISPFTVQHVLSQMK